MIQCQIGIGPSCPIHDIYTNRSLFSDLLGCFDLALSFEHFWKEIKHKMTSSISIPRRLPLLMVQDNVLLPGSSMRIPVRNVRK